MKSGFKVIHLIIIFILIVLTTFAFNSLTKYINYKKNYEPFEKIEKTNSKIILNGNYLTYLNIGDRYEELNASAYDESGNDISDKAMITYYNNGEQVFSIDTRFVDEYIVKYKVNNMIASRVVIISDMEAPKFEPIETKTITREEAATYNVNDDVKATDNSGKVKIECDNSLSTLPGNYTINCKASDPYGNISTKKRLIKVV